MSDVKRFDFDVTGCQIEDPLGGYVDHDDYAKLAAEAQALREQVAAFEDGMRSLACQLGAGGFNAEKLTAAQLIEKVQWGINNLAETQGRLLDEVRSERDALRARVVVPEGYVLVPVELTRDMWVAVNKEDDKAFAGGCDHGAQFDWLWQAAIEAAPSLKVIAVSIADISARLDAELREWTGDHRKAVERALTDANGRIMAMIEDGNELTEARVDRDELREMVVVVPDRRVLPNYTDHPLLYCEMTGFNNCLDELSRLNGKAVSEGLLRRLGQVISWQCFGDCRAFSDQRIPEPSEVIEELRALLGEGKEVGDVL